MLGSFRSSPKPHRSEDICPFKFSRAESVEGEDRCQTLIQIIREHHPTLALSEKYSYRAWNKYQRIGQRIRHDYDVGVVNKDFLFSNLKV